MASAEDYKSYGHLFVFSGANKAGMDGYDKERQAQIIYEMSKNSAYFKRAAKIDESTSEKVKVMQDSIASITPSLQLKLEAMAAKNFVELEKKRSFSRICCVLDMDMFYAAVEIRDQPHLKDLPVAVGGDMMISTANYVARKYGVRAAMPGFIAKKLCPELVYVKCNFPKYEAVSAQLKAIIGEYDPDYSSHSLDEVYFDLTNAAKKRFHEAEGNNLGDFSTKNNNIQCNKTVMKYRKEADCYISDDESEEDSRLSLNCQSTSLTLNSANNTYNIVELRKHAVDILQEIRRRIREVTNGLTASAGIANNFYLAKICADINKPDGQFELGCTREEVMQFITPLSCRKVGGIGKVTENMLEKLGMKTLGEVRANMASVLHVFTPISSGFLQRVCIGIADEEGETDEERRQRKAVPEGVVTRKSISCDRTYSARGIDDPVELSEKLQQICEHLHQDMAKENLWGKTVTLKLKTVTFELLTRNITHRTYVQSAEDIKMLAQQVLDGLMPVNIRLMGVSVRNFKDAYDPDAVEIPGQRSVKQFFGSNSTTSSSSLFDSVVNPLTHVNAKDSSKGNGSCSINTVIKGNKNQQNKVEIIELEDEDDNVEDLFDCSAYNDNMNEIHETSGDYEEYAAAEEEEKQLSQHLADVFTYMCPVCNKCIYGNNETFNTHIDICLTESAGLVVKSTSNSSSLNVKKGADALIEQQSKKENSIDNFFSKPQAGGKRDRSMFDFNETNKKANIVNSNGKSSNSRSPDPKEKTAVGISKFFKK